MTTKRYPRAQDAAPPKYTPAYKKKGIIPEPFDFNPGLENVAVSSGAKENPRFPRPMVSVEAFNFDDSMPVTAIDNNDYVDPSIYEGTSEDAYLAKSPTYQNKEELAQAPKAPRVPPGYEAADFNRPKQVVPQPRPSMRPIPPKPKYFFSTLQDGEYCLFVGNDPVASSFSKEEIQEEVEQLLYGTHSSYPEQEVPFAMICVMKKCTIKSGIYLE